MHAAILAVWQIPAFPLVDLVNFAIQACHMVLIVYAINRRLNPFPNFLHV